MAPVEIIRRKRDGARLSREELTEFVRGAAAGDWSEGQLAAMLMAISLVGMDDEETGLFTRAIASSGSRLDLRGLGRPLADKHSTGGVGDKTSLVVAPLAAACGVAVPMMSGRALAHTGGTLDKLEAIPGMKVDLSLDELSQVVAEVGCVICGATREIAPADRVLYSLRNSTGTVKSIPLITASILGKKLAEGIEGLVLDVKCGSGTFMQTDREARDLGESLQRGGTAAGVRTRVLISRMDVPLGRAVGEAVEVAEAIEVLRGGGPDDLRELSIELATGMLVECGVAKDDPHADQIVRRALDRGDALERFGRMIECQGGDVGVVDDPLRLPQANDERMLTADRDGFFDGIDAGVVGRVVAELCGPQGDPASGLLVEVETGSELREGQPVIRLVGNDSGQLESAAVTLAGQCRIVESPPVERPLVIATIGAR